MPAAMHRVECKDKTALFLGVPLAVEEMIKAMSDYTLREYRDNIQAKKYVVEVLRILHA